MVEPQESLDSKGENYESGDNSAGTLVLSGDTGSRGAGRTDQRLGGKYMDPQDFYCLKDVPHGTIRQEYFYSNVTGEWERCLVYVPAEYFSYIGLFSGFLRDFIQGHEMIDMVQREKSADEHLKALNRREEFNQRYKVFFRAMGKDDIFFRKFLEEDEIFHKDY